MQNTRPSGALHKWISKQASASLVVQPKVGDAVEQ